MVAHVRCTGLIGTEAVRIDVEAQIFGRKPSFRIVGLPDSALRESKDRVRCAIENSGFRFPEAEVVVGLAPATLPKTGAGFDLAIALSILAAAGEIDHYFLRSCVVLGELAFDGRLKRTAGVVAAACYVSRLKGMRLIAPVEDYHAARMVPGVEIAAVRSLLETVNYVRHHGELPLVPPEKLEPNVANGHTKGGPPGDFGDVIGQHAAKRALQIAAAGGHNVLMIGPPGSGKSLLASRLPSILPPLTAEEVVEVTKVYAAFDHLGEGGTMLGERMIEHRPFRAPHHTASTAGLIGGGPVPRPGEISLAHRGVLFLDEFPEYRRESLESLRQPLEDRVIMISRSTMRVKFPADFILVAAMNPCPCGYRGHLTKRCACHPLQVRKYFNRISGPLLDRLDLQIWVPPLTADELKMSAIPLINRGAQACVAGEENPTSKMLALVLSAREVQRVRFDGGLRTNSSMTPKLIQQTCKLDSDGRRFIECAVERLNLTTRGYSRVLKVARTIADLEGSEWLKVEHLAEAVSYRLGPEFGG